MNWYSMTEDEAYAEAQRLIWECREKKGTMLNLKDFNLRTIPPEIAELETLEALYLGPFQKKYELTLPAEMGNLKKLDYLDLGFGIREIPDWIGNLESLEILNILNDDIETIPAAISNLKKLRELWLWCDKLASLPSEMGEMLYLDSLELWCPQLKTLPESFANLKTMKSFRFFFCNLSALPDFICGWTELTDLTISMDIMNKNFPNQ